HHAEGQPPMRQRGSIHVNPSGVRIDDSGQEVTYWRTVIGEGEERYLLLTAHPAPVVGKRKKSVALLRLIRPDKDIHPFARREEEGGDLIRFVEQTAVRSCQVHGVVFQ